MNEGFEANEFFFEKSFPSSTHFKNIQFLDPNQDRDFTGLFGIFHLEISSSKIDGWRGEMEKLSRTINVLKSKCHP